MKSFRKLVFWLHLIAGVIAGIVILIMSVTGAILAFQPNIEAFAERTARRVEPPTDGTSRLDAKTMLERAQTARPDLKPTGLTVQSDQSAAATLAVGREGNVYVNPYTGEITGGSAKSTRAFFQLMTDWHRWLATSGDNRALGKAVTGACNLAFLFLAISGIYIWFPRKLTWQHFKPISFFRWNVTGRARDFNWHNVAGIWTAAVLIILTATGAVISYQWASNLVYYATGNQPPPPAPPRPPGGGEQQANAGPFVAPENLAALWSRAETHSPGWRSINVRFPLAENAPAVFTIDEGKYLNPFGRSQLQLDQKTTAIVKWEPYGEQNAGRQLRSWARFTHTGESFGIVGQIIGFIACLAGALLVWTGISLALRRLARWWMKRKFPITDES